MLLHCQGTHSFLADELSRIPGSESFVEFYDARLEDRSAPINQDRTTMLDITMS